MNRPLRDMLIPVATRLQEMLEAEVLFPERCIFLFFCQEVCSLSKGQGHRKRQREPLPLRATAKGKCTSEGKRNRSREVRCSEESGKGGEGHKKEKGKEKNSKCVRQVAGPAEPWVW